MTETHFAEIKFKDRETLENFCAILERALLYGEEDREGDDLDFLAIDMLAMVERALRKYGGRSAE